MIGRGTPRSSVGDSLTSYRCEWRSDASTVACRDSSDEDEDEDAVE